MNVAPKSRRGLRAALEAAFVVRSASQGLSWKSGSGPVEAWTHQRGHLPACPRSALHSQRWISTGRKCFDGAYSLLRRGNTSPSRPQLFGPVAFCVASSATFFTYAAFKEEESSRLPWGRLRSAAGLRQPDLPAWIGQLPLFVENLYREFWLDLSAQQRAVGVITGINVAIFAASRALPSLRNFMVVNFMQALPPLPLKSTTLLTSGFMHQTTVHLGVNMLAFWSFGSEAARAFGAEQFSAFYLSAGLASGLLSHLGRIRSKAGGFSFGASGAVYACFAVAALTRPNTEVVIIFLPWFPINILDAFSLMVAVDAAGALLRWRTFDHLGHLGGALFGWYYAKYGQYEMWPKFQHLAEKMQKS